MTDKPKKKKKSFFNPVAAIILIVFAFAGGIITQRMLAPEQAANSTTPEKKTKWTCSMHPQVIRDEPGTCPLCQMDLIPLESDHSSTSLASNELSLSPEAIKLMEIETALVQRKHTETSVRLVGKLDYDETRLKHITAWVPGRIDRMYVDFNGTSVIKGDHMVSLYSPELISAQAEYLQALKSQNSTPDTASDLVKNSVTSTVTAANEKLRLLGLSQNQIEMIAQNNTPQDNITINAPIEGTVIEKHLNEGNYVNQGTMLYTIADLSHLWARLDAYESDLTWLRYGQTVKFQTEAYPGETFNGKIMFISPIVDPKTRTVKVRVDINNPDGKLKPNMFIRATVHSHIASHGKVMDPFLAGKWICPMHPSVIKETPDQCDICQMDLVTTESLGYVSADSNDQPPLIIPATAPLITGTRAIVYVQLPNTEKPTFQPREIVLGPRAGDNYIVKEGLQEGERVVINGNFKIDSELQIQAKPSMMNPIPMKEHMDHSAMNHTNQTEQTLCPVMNNPINKDVFIEYQGKKVYFCCPGCNDTFLANPEKYIDKLPQFKHSMPKNDMEPDNTSAEQTLCPVLGNPINKDIFVEYNGKKVYFCCSGCDEKFLANPEKYIDKLPQFKN